MTQSDGVYTALTVAENARFFAATYGVRGHEAVDRRRSRSSTSPTAPARSPGTLSGGQRRRLSLACALVHRPPVLFLDEPTVGVDPLLRVQFWAHFRALADAGTTIVVSSHVMDEADRCDELLFIRSGKVIARGTGREIRERAGTDDLEQAFLHFGGERRGDPMSGRRIAALFRRVTEEIRRDRPSIALLFIAPLIITGLVTFILREGETPTIDGGDRQPGRPAWDGRGRRARGGASASQDATVTEARRRGGRPVADRGRLGVGRDRPPGRAPDDRASPTITVITNGLDPAGEAIQLAALQKALAGGGERRVGRSLPTIDHATVYGTPSSDPITSYAPALVAFFVYFFVYLLTGVSFLRERTGGTLERLMATPVVAGRDRDRLHPRVRAVRRSSRSTLLMLWVLGTIHVPAIGPLPAFSIGLGVTVAGSPLLAFLVVLLLAMGAVSLGIFLSTFARTELQIIQFIPIVIVPQFLLSGVLFPVSSLPAVIQPLAPLLPLSYAVDGLRQVFIRGADLGVAALRIDLARARRRSPLFFATIAALTIRREVV